MVWGMIPFLELAHSPKKWREAQEKPSEDLFAGFPQSFFTMKCHTWERWKLPFRQVASSPTLAPYLCGLGAAPGGGSFGVEADRRLHLEKAWRKRGRPVLVSEFMMNYSNSPFDHTYGPTL